MKLIIMATMALLGTLANADVVSRTYESNLQTFNLDGNLALEYGDIDVYGGVINLDYGRKEATLTLYRRLNCPPNAMCIELMPAPIVVKMEIKSQKTDSCGVKVVTADDFNPYLPVAIMPNIHRVTVMDNRKNRCPTLQALPFTEVEFTTEFNVHSEHSFRVFSHSTMTGGRLTRTDDRL